jgi:hypothetical protein
MPEIVLRISHPTPEDAQEDPEMTFVHIFATNLTRTEKAPMTLQTGKSVTFSEAMQKQVAQERPQFFEKAQKNLITATHIILSHESKGEKDVDGRSSRPLVITGATSGRWSLDNMRRHALSGKDGQTPQERFLGHLHKEGIRQLSLFTEYESENGQAEYPREAAFCGYFKLIMVLCEQPGNFWAYRRQFPDISRKDATFPLSELSPPRWTIKSWLKRSVSTAAGQTAAPPRAAEWEPINRPKVFPGDEEEAFLRGLREAGRGFVRED